MKISKSLRLATLAGFMAFAPIAAIAETTVLLQLDGFPGGSQHGDGWVEVLSLEWGVHASTEGSGRPREGASLAEMHVVRASDSGSPDLARAVAEGIIFPSAIVEVRDDLGRLLMTYEMGDLLVSSYQSSGSAGGDSLPMESFTFNYEKVLFTSYEAETGQPKAQFYGTRTQ